jgi:pimeloyl-ACP methyl ester carboxylesterase
LIVVWHADLVATSKLWENEYVSDSEFESRIVRLDTAAIHVVESGSAANPVVIFLHGWPQSARAFEFIMREASDSIHAIAIDLPGIGQSTGSDGGDKRSIALKVRTLIRRLGLKRVTLVGHDVGGQVVFSYLTNFVDELEQAVIMDVVVPGIAPWDDVVSNPDIWHFAFHNVPKLPEELIAGRQAAYFDWIFNSTAKRPSAISPQARREYAAAYETLPALTAGLEWYRAFDRDVRENRSFAMSSRQTSVPVLYVRGADESGKIEEYVAGLRAAGLSTVVGATIPNCGHFSPEEQPRTVWKAISEFIGLSRER